MITSRKAATVLLRYAVFAMCVPLSGCVAGPTTGKTVDALLSAAGLKLAERDVMQRSRQVSFRMEGARDLNASMSGQGVATVVRIYQLRSQNVFLSAPYRLFGDIDKEKATFGSDLAEVKEFILMPGQTVNVNEKLSGDVAYVGVAALFHKPAAQRWRLTFNANDAEQTGVVLGLHTCAMTSSGAVPVGMHRNDAVLLSTAPCPE